MATQFSPQINGLVVTYRQRTALKPHPQNPNTHSPKQIERIARSIRDFGWTNPIIIDEEDKVLAGHGRLLAAAKIGIDMVPTICLAHLSAAQRRAYVILDNRLSEIGGTWDKKLLALEHDAIRLLDPDFDLTTTGFELDDIEIMFDGLNEVLEDHPSEPDRTSPAVARAGDLWLLGDHRLYCGDARIEASFEALLGKAFKNMADYLDAAAKAAATPTYEVEFARNGKTLKATVDRAFRPTWTEAVVAIPDPKLISGPPVAAPRIADEPLGR